ncbi:putative transcriptional regulator [Haloferax mucosum ATCC BAA-1512]|uniref:Putative transcriptional regulator n=1 Tax=Haloferax mucosum ATCC BAA-1512 TaxID=662479 RepID=M0IT88_9EURY|nr:winged helix-turn-helix domain-containing protein [Haloferax mucosum]ELZ98998.1 putative transcriptional regulator [Haloferax mucosum ATCC BAA-1512]
MEKALWYLFAGSRGGTTRAKLIRALSERPRNANQLSDVLGMDYNTVRYHLDLLVEHDILETGDETYGTMYFFTDRFEQHRDQFETIVSKIE